MSDCHRSETCSVSGHLIGIHLFSAFPLLALSLYRLTGNVELRAFLAQRLVRQLSRTARALFTFARTPPFS